MPNGTETPPIIAKRYYPTLSSVITKDDNEREFANKAANVFLLLTFLGVGASLVTRVKLTHSAKEVVNDAKFLTLPSDVQPVIRNLAESLDEAADLFSTKLSAWPNVLSKFNNPAWNDALREAFYLDFKNLSDTDLGRLNDFPASLDNWKDLFDLRVNERAIVDFITKQNQVGAIKKLYSFPEIREVLEPLENSKKWKFLDDFGEQPDDWFDFLKDNPSAIQRWNNLNGSGKLFARQKPERWLYVFDRLYVNYSYGQKLSNSTILNLFGQRGVNLVDDVEVQALLEYAEITSNKLRKKKVLTSGANCQVTGETVIKTNMSDEVLRTLQSNGKSTYSNYMDTMFPNLKRKVEDAIAFNRQNYNVTTGYDVRRTGNFPGAHAEIQAIDELAKIRFSDYITNPPSDAVFDIWLRNDVLAYNRNIMVTENANNVIMHTCADCFHILDFVKFINNFN